MQTHHTEGVLLSRAALEMVELNQADAGGLGGDAEGLADALGQIPGFRGIGGERHRPCRDRQLRLLLTIRSGPL